MPIDILKLRCANARLGHFTYKINNRLYLNPFFGDIGLPVQ